MIARVNTGNLGEDDKDSDGLPPAPVDRGNSFQM